MTRPGQVKKLLPFWIGPYKIISSPHPNAYKLDLPDTMKIHPVFNVKLLKPYVANDKTQFPLREPERPGPITISEDDQQYEVEDIIDHRTFRRQLQYLVTWKGWPIEETTWIAAFNMNAPDLIKEYWSRRGEEPPTKSSSTSTTPTPQPKKTPKPKPTPPAPAPALPPPVPIIPASPPTPATGLRRSTRIGQRTASALDVQPIRTRTRIATNDKSPTMGTARTQPATNDKKTSARKYIEKLLLESNIRRNSVENPSAPHMIPRPAHTRAIGETTPLKPILRTYASVLSSMPRPSVAKKNGGEWKLPSTVTPNAQASQHPAPRPTRRVQFKDPVPSTTTPTGSIPITRMPVKHAPPPWHTIVDRPMRSAATETRHIIMGRALRPMATDPTNHNMPHPVPRWSSHVSFTSELPPSSTDTPFGIFDTASTLPSSLFLYSVRQRDSPLSPQPTNVCPVPSAHRLDRKKERRRIEEKQVKLAAHSINSAGQSSLVLVRKNT